MKMLTLLVAAVMSGPTQVLCDDVKGWFVVRLRS
jgi:hypothetical protein